MNIISRCVAICIIMQLVMAGCGNNVANNDETGGIKSVHVSQEDSMAFEYDAKRICVVKSGIDAVYPQYYMNDTLTRQLQSLYITEILNVAQDSADVQDAIATVLEMQIRQFGDSKDEVLYGIFPNKRVLHYSIVTNITPLQTKGDIAAFCKRETVNKDGESTVDTHHYINLDLTSMSRIDVYDLFAEDALSYVSSLLKNKLLEQLNVKDEDELIGQGYFNLDNITVNNNFYFNEKGGITWNYVTYEIACYSVGETQISLNYDELSPYISSKSRLYTYLKKHEI